MEVQRYIEMRLKLNCTVTIHVSIDRHYRLSDTIMLTLQVGSSPFEGCSILNIMSKKIRSSLASTTLSDEPLSAADPTDLDNVSVYSESWKVWNKESNV